VEGRLSKPDTMTSIHHFPDGELDRLGQFLKEEFGGIFSKGNSICVKLHMGELNNTAYLRPEIAKVVVDALKAVEAEPFLFDSLTVYRAHRHTVEDHLNTAAAHGFTHEAMGCPVVVGPNEEYEEVPTAHLNARVCTALYNADGMVVLSHVKGHGCCGFGAAVKNLGMGGLTAQTKSDIHEGARPLILGECVGCGVCVDECEDNNLYIEDGHVHMEDPKKCYGCDRCIISCPQDAMRPRVALFDTLLAEGASACLENKGGKLYFVNVLEKITKECDCFDRETTIIHPENLGYLCARNAVSVDTASVDMVNEASGRELFKEENHKDPMLHVKMAEVLGMGDLEYELERHQ